jgi:hypothetical protein
VAFSRLNCIRSSSSISFGFSVISFSIAGFYRDSVFHAHEGWQQCWPVTTCMMLCEKDFSYGRWCLSLRLCSRIELELHQSQSCLRAELSLKNIYIYIYIYIYLHEYWEVPERSVLGSARGSVGTSSSGTRKIPLNIPSSSLVTCSWITCKSRDSVNSLHKVH